MKTILYRGSSRGHANHGWLDTWHTFSFANYYDPSRMHFGSLRVFNDDYIAGGEGFGRHPHDNMEITTIVLEGTLNQKAWFSRIDLGKGKEAEYELHDPLHGVYIMMIKGTADVDGNRLETRDGLGAYETARVGIKAESDSDILLIEIPMQA